MWTQIAALGIPEVCHEIVVRRSVEEAADAVAARVIHGLCYAGVLRERPSQTRKDGCMSIRAVYITDGDCACVRGVEQNT